MLRKLIPDPFIIWLLATVALAALLPASGWAATLVDWLATAAIVLLFFFHGAKLPREAVIAGLAHWRLHLMVLGTTFLLFPLLGLGTVKLAGDSLSVPLATGMLFLCALPSTVQSSIAFTSMARGNVPAAIASASASQILGVFLTPLLVGLMLSRQGGDFSVSGLGPVLLIVLLPFVLGHLSRPLTAAWINRHKSAIGISDRSAILLAVYSAFSEATVNGLWQQLPVSQLLLLAAICTALLALVLLITWLAGRWAGFTVEDRITLLFCGSKKSLVQGIPMARVLFAGPELGMILLPAMIFHQIQLMACAWIAGRYARRADNKPA